jgi:hypothetical protein
MKKMVLVAMVASICIISAFSGCQDTSSVKTSQRPQNVFLDSTIVEFANVTYEENIDDSGRVTSVTVSWLFHNIAGKTINAKIDVKFYDANDILLYNTTKYILNMPVDYIEKTYQSANKVTYGEAGATLVDHVVISVSEQ